MSLLSQVKRGRIEQPFLGIVYGTDGSGKSTLASEAPNPIFLGTEKGTYNLDVARLPTPKDFKEVMQAINELATEKHDYKTLVIDSLDWLEPLVWEQVVFDAGNPSKIKSIEDIGYGKGYVAAIDHWRSMHTALSRVREKGIHVVLIAHAQVKEAKDPTVMNDYNRYMLKLNEKAAALWREYVDAVLFMNFEVTTGEDKKGKVRAYGDGSRYLFTERRPAFDAKNRFSLPFQIEMTLGAMWSALTDAIKSANPEDTKALYESIKGLLTNVTDETVKQNAITSVNEAVAASDLEKLKRIHEKLNRIVNNAA